MAPRSRSSSANDDPPRGAKAGGAVRTLIVALLFGVLLAGVMLAGAGYVAWRQFTAPGPTAGEAGPRIVYVEPGSGVRAIAETLAKEGVLDRVTVFRAGVRLTGAGRALRAGEYAVPPGASPRALVALLTSGVTHKRSVTAPEGVTTAALLAALRAEPFLTGELPSSAPEGAFLPETYAFERGDARADVLARMKAAQDALLEELWPDRAGDLPFESPEEAIILASIIEKETAVAEERPRVAAVFVNRLRRGMRLQSDPTVVYGITEGAPLGRGLRRSELDADTPYNTYRRGGLPPTPIANPGAAAIAAVLNPAETDDLYFVADGEGGHAFAESYEEHQKNVAAWRAVERARGEATP